MDRHTEGRGKPRELTSQTRMATDPTIVRRAFARGEPVRIHITPGIRSGVALLTESVGVVGGAATSCDRDLRSAFLRAVERTDAPAPADKLASLAFGLSYLSLVMLGQLASTRDRSPDEQLRELALQLADQLDEQP